MNKYSFVIDGFTFERVNKKQAATRRFISRLNMWIGSRAKSPHGQQWKP